VPDNIVPGAAYANKRPDLLHVQGWAGAAGRVRPGRHASLLRLLWVEFTTFSDDAYL